jgi:outer membrane protein assembly factor BamB
MPSQRCKFFRMGFFFLLFSILFTLFSHLCFSASLQGDKDSHPSYNFAVVGFPTHAPGTGNDWLGVGLGEDLSTRLSQVDGIFPVERLQINLLMASANMNMLAEGVSEKGGKAEDERLKKIGDVLKGGSFFGASRIIIGSLIMTGSYGDRNSTLVANARVVDAETGRITKAVSVTGTGDAKGYMRLQEDLAEALAEKMNIPLEKRVRVLELKHRTASSDAYEAFCKARKLLYEGKYAEAIEMCHESESLGVASILEQLRKTENEAHEQLIKQEKDPEKALSMADAYIRHAAKRKADRKEQLAIEAFYEAEGYRIKGEKLDALTRASEAQIAYSKAIEFYDEYLKNTSSQLLLWEFEGDGEIFRPKIAKGIVYAGSSDGYLRAFDAKTGKIVWQFKAEDEIYTPVVADGIAYAGSDDKDDKQLRAFDAKTGRMLWDFKAESTFDMNVINCLPGLDCGSNHWIYDPVVANGIVYAGSEDMHLRAFDSKTGKLLWDFKADGSKYKQNEVAPSTNREYVSGFWISSPVVVNGTVYAGSWDHHLRAFNAKKGSLLWDFQEDLRYTSKHCGIYTPAIGDGIVCAMSSCVFDDKKLRAFDAKTGELLWDFQTDLTIFSPVVVDGIVYAGSSSENGLYAFDSKTGKLIWQFKSYGICTPVVVEGIAYAGQYRVIKAVYLRAFDAKTGKLLWDFKADRTIHTPVVADGIVYAGCKDGYLRAFDAKTGKLRWDFMSRHEINTPVVADGIAYSRSWDHLLAFNTTIREGVRPGETVNKAILTKTQLLLKQKRNQEALRIIAYILLQTEDRSSEFFQTLLEVLQEKDIPFYLRQPFLRLPVASKDRFINHEFFATTFKELGLLWDFRANDTVDRPVVADGIVYLGSRDKHLRAFNANTGKLLWDFEADSAIPTPEVTDGIVYAGSAGEHLRAFDAKTGSLLWDLDFEEYCSQCLLSPVVADGIVYVCISDKRHSGAHYHLLAIDGKTGDLYWDCEAKSFFWPPIVTDGIVYAYSNDGLLRAFDAKTGTLLWNGGKIFILGILDGVVYAGSHDGYLHAFNGKTGELVWRSSKPFNFFDFASLAIVNGKAYDSSANDQLRVFEMKKGRLNWPNHRIVEYADLPSWVAEADFAVSYGLDRSLRTFDVKTHELLWDFSTDGYIRFALENGVVYAGSSDDHLRAFDANSGRIIWDFETNYSMPSPVVADGIVYVGEVWGAGGRGRLYAFSEKAITSGKHMPPVTWGNRIQFYSYVIWDKAGLASRMIEDGYSLKQVIKQTSLSRKELAEGIDRLARGTPYNAPGAAALDPALLCPHWLRNIKGNGTKGIDRPSVLFYLNAAKKRQHEKDQADVVSYLAEVLRLAPNIDLEARGFTVEQINKATKRLNQGT